MGQEIAQAIAAGILGGGVYALMAAGLTLIFGVLDIINVAQGILVVLGAYLSYALFVHLHINLLVGLLITVPAMFVLGVMLYWLFIRPLRGAERTSMTLLACFAIALIIEGVLYREFGSGYVSINAPYTTDSVHIFNFYLADIYLIGFALAVLSVAVLYLILYRTTFGRAVRATMQNPAAARLIGIDVNRVSALTFGIGTAVTAIGGMVYGAISGGFTPDSGYDLISRLLAIVILAGMGSIGGALAAAVFMTLAEALVDIWQPDWSVAVFYLAMVIILTVRPAGLFGRRAVRAQ
jgi:branched-chain amino acid transport system permease protein